MDHRGSHRGGKCQHAEDLHAEPTAGVRLKLVGRPFRNGQFPLRHPVAWQRHHVSPGRFSLLDRLSQDRCGLLGTRRSRMRQIGVAQDMAVSSAAAQASTRVSSASLSAASSAGSATCTCSSSKWT